MKIFFTMSVYGTAIILITVFLRTFFIEKLPKKVFKLLWLLAAARMLLPFFISIRVDMPLRSNLEYTPPPFYDSAETHEVITKKVFTEAENKTKKKAPDVIAAVCAGGTLLSALFFVTAYIRGVKKYKSAEALESTEISEIISSIGLHRKITVLESKTAATFLTYGIINPKIICPKNFLSGDKNKIKFAVMHEILHIKNFDALYKIIVAAVVCLHWFNPFAWVMLVFANRDLELSCDEELLRKFPLCKKDYALALIDFEEKRGGFPIFNSFGKNAVKERIEMIMKFKKTAVISTAAAAGIVLCTASVFALSAELKTPAVNTASDSDSQTVYDEYGNAFSIAENELLTVVYDEYGNVVSTDKTKYETETAVVYDEKTTDIEYSSDKKGSYYTPDGTEISLPPNAAPGVIKSVPEEERLSGISAAEELKSNFAEADDFTYPLDEKYNELYEYYGGFSVSVPKGENIYAMSDGTVISADFSFPFGKSLVIQHDNGDVWLYAHCDELCVNTDDKIKAGDIIAYVGSTGAAPDNRLYIYNYYNSSVSNRLNNQDIEN